MSASCPLYPQKQTLYCRRGMSAKCHKQTLFVDPTLIDLDIKGRNWTIGVEFKPQAKIVMNS